MGGHFNNGGGAASTILSILLAASLERGKSDRELVILFLYSHRLLLGLIALFLLGLLVLSLLGIRALFLLGLLALEVARPRGCLLLMPSTAVPSRASLLQRPNLHSLP